MSHHDPNAIMGRAVTFDMVNLSLQNDKDYLATRVSHAVQPAGPEPLGADGLLVVAGRGPPGLPEPAERRMRHGAGRRRRRSASRTTSATGTQPGSMVSAVGHCRPFDVRADGTIFGSGVAVVVLKPLQAAVDDGDRIHAVIRGSAINNDGSMKMTYAAPNRRRSGRRHRRGARGRRRRFVDDQLRRDATEPARRWATRSKSKGLRQAFEVSEADPARPVRRRFGQVEHRSPGGRPPESPA